MLDIIQLLELIPVKASTADLIDSLLSFQDSRIFGGIQVCNRRYIVEV